MKSYRIGTDEAIVRVGWSEIYEDVTRLFVRVDFIEIDRQQC